MKILQITFLTLCFYSCAAQISYNELCKELYRYTEVSGGFVKTINDNGDYTELFKIEELASKDTTLLKQNGVYKFEYIAEDAPLGIFIEKDDFFEIYRISTPGFFLPKVMAFLNDSSVSFTDSIKLLYINRIIEIYQEDSEYKTNIILEKESGRFKYYF